MSLVPRAALFLCPFFLLFMEWVLRLATEEHDPAGFWAPSLTSCGVSQLFPILTTDKEPAAVQGSGWKGALIENLRSFALIAMFGGIALWSLILLESLNHRVLLPLVPGMPLSAGGTWALAYYTLINFLFFKNESGGVK
jgi:hypothetical protein